MRAGRRSQGGIPVIATGGIVDGRGYARWPGVLHNVCWWVLGDHVWVW